MNRLLVALIAGVLLSVIGTGLIASTRRRPAVPSSNEDAHLYELVRKG